MPAVLGNFGAGFQTLPTKTHMSYYNQWSQVRTDLACVCRSEVFFMFLIIMHWNAQLPQNKSWVLAGEGRPEKKKRDVWEKNILGMARLLKNLDCSKHSSLVSCWNEGKTKGSCSHSLITGVCGRWAPGLTSKGDRTEAQAETPQAMYPWGETRKMKLQNSIFF